MPEMAWNMQVDDKHWIFGSFTSRIHDRGERIEYLKKLRNSGMKIKELKKILLEYEDYSATNTARWIIISCTTAAKRAGISAHEKISNGMCAHASKSAKHDKSLRTPWARRWIDSWRSKIRDVESYDEMMELYTDNKVFKPMIYSYVRNVMNRSRKI